MNKIKSILIIVSVLLLTVVITGGTLAYLIAPSIQIQNTFVPTTVAVEVTEETFDKKVKKDVAVQSTGSAPVYIRAAIVATWKADDGAVYGQAPVVNGDYTISINTSTQTNPNGIWFIGSDGFYYWSEPVTKDTSTGILINECKPKRNLTVGETTYYLNVEILAQAIQADGVDSSSGKSPVEQVWGVTKNGTTISKN